MYAICQGFSGGSGDKESACNTGIYLFTEERYYIFDHQSNNSLNA